MAFPDNVVKQAWERAAGQCECEKRTHPHFYIPCGKRLVWENRGGNGFGAWEIKRINENKGEVLANCEIVCMTCYEANY